MNITEFVKKYLGKYKISGKEIVIEECPFCHRKKWKFSINNQSGLYQCFSGSCRETGSVNTLFKKHGVEELTFNKKTSDLKNYVIGLTEKSKQFLNSRGITDKTILRNRFDICSTKNNETAFIYRKGFEVHSIKNRGNDTKKFTATKLKELTLWKLDFADPEEALIICEGEIDVLSFEEQNINNVVSVPFGANTFTWLDTDYNILEKFKEIIIAVDNDAAGAECRKELLKRLPEADKMRSVDWGKYKDANEALKAGEDLQSFLDGAKDVYHEYYVDLERDSDEDIKKYGVGSVNLNRMIGCIRSGELTIWTGSAGSGKSSFLNQILLEMCKKHNSFVFSPELRLGQFKEWVSRQLIPEDRNGFIKKSYCDLEERERFEVSKDKQSLMMKWLNKRLRYIKPTKKISNKKLLTMIDKKIRSEKIEFIVVDNLLKIDFDAADQKKEQNIHRDFVEGLKNLAVKYNVSIHLVCHPKKHDMDDPDQYVVSGTSNMVNLADNLFYVRRCVLEEIENTKLPKDVKEKALEYQTSTLFKNLKSREGVQIGVWQHLHFDAVRKRFRHINDEEFYNTDWIKKEKINFNFQEKRELIEIEDIFPDFVG